MGSIEVRWITLDEAVARGGASSGFSQKTRQQTRVRARFLDGKIETYPGGKTFDAYNDKGRISRPARVADIVFE